MSDQAQKIDHPSPEQMRLTRWFPASPALLWRLWTDPAHVARWFGPDSASDRRATSDLRVGGSWGVDFHAYGGLRRVRGVYLEIEAPHRLTTTWAWLNEDGVKGEESQYALTFVAEGDGARLTLIHTLPTAEQAAQHGQGWSGAIEALAAYVGLQTGA